MSKAGMASVQFGGAMGDDNSYGGHRLGLEIGREQVVESPVGLSSRNLASADAATAWRVRRTGPPLPYSRKTRSSLYTFDDAATVPSPPQ